MAKYLKNLKIAGVSPCLFKVTTILDTKMSYPPDLLKRQFIKKRTRYMVELRYYLPKTRKWRCPAVRDECSSKVLNSEVDDNIKTEILTKALNQAIAKRNRNVIRNHIPHRQR